MLDAFRDALTAKRWPELLTLLLDDWRKDRDPRLADLIELVSTCVDEFLECPGGTNPKRRVAQWEQFLNANDPRTLRPALRALEGWKRSQFEEALAKLQSWPDDPRLTSWHDEGLFVGPQELHVAPLINRGDVRALARLRPLQRELEGSFTREELAIEVSDAVEALQRLRVIEKWSAADLDVVKNEVNAFLEARRRMRTELFAAVYAKPDDDGPRAVLADFLQELGDVRGEFIALQLAHSRPSNDRRRTKRETELFELWAERWTQRLSDAVLKGTAFRRGFPSVCTLRDTEPTLDTPEWATIEQIDSTGLGARDPGSFFAARRFPALRRLGPIDPIILSSKEPTAIEELTLTWCGDNEFVRLFDATRFPRLRALTIEAQSRIDPMLLDQLAGAPAAATWRELTCNISATAVPRWARVLVGHRGPLTTVKLTGLGSSWWWTLTPSTKGLRVSDAGWVNAELEAEHRALPVFSS